jgi:hypothetical protein
MFAFRTSALSLTTVDLPPYVYHVVVVQLRGLFLQDLSMCRSMDCERVHHLPIASLVFSPIIRVYFTRALQSTSEPF